MNQRSLRAMVARGEGERLEFKRSTAELRSAFQTLCAFLNGAGGAVVIGVLPEGKLVGQQVSDATLRDVAKEVALLEPAAKVAIERVRLDSGSEALVLRAAAGGAQGPFTFDGRPYTRVASTTRRMAQSAYGRMFLDRPGSGTRWEEQPAVHTRLEDLDEVEVRRLVEMARMAKRLAGPDERDVVRLLEQLQVVRDGAVLQAGVVLFGRNFMPSYPQCELQMARFRGTDKREFIDQQDLRGPALRLLEAALAFLERHLPVAGRVSPGQLQRMDRPLLPPEALREILVNALIHRDYAVDGTSVSLAIFDDRVEVWSPGRLPTCVTLADLTREHKSHLRNPVIAEAFHRAGLIEKWGRGTNRVIEQCREWNIEMPEFFERSGCLVVRFRAPVGETLKTTVQVGAHVSTHVPTHVTTQVARLLVAAREPVSREELQEVAGITERRYFTRMYLAPLMAAGWLARTVPGKPRSRLQRYRTTGAGLDALERARPQDPAGGPTSHARPRGRSRSS